MAHGFSAVRDQRLDAYAERFAAAGLAALVFDYRHFGASEGEPRQLLSIKRQLEDWAAAIAYARTLSGVDPAKIAVWGSSFSGGHVMTLVARDHRLAAGVAQAPFADGLVNLPALGVSHSLKLSAAGIRDQVGALLGRPPHMIGAVGAPGSLAVMTSPDAEPGFRRMTPQSSTWRNEVAARVALTVGLYRPGRGTAKATCPLLVCVCDNDVVTPPKPAIAAAARAPHGELQRYPLGHFDIYLGEAFERAVDDQTRFLTRVLLGEERSGAPAREPAATS